MSIDQPVQDAHAESLPVGGMIGGDFGHSLAAGVRQASQCPRIICRGVQAERALITFRFDLFPQRSGRSGPLPARLRCEAIAQPLAKLRRGHRRQAAE